VKAADLDSMKGGFVSPGLWKDCAVEYLQTLEKGINNMASHTEVAHAWAHQTGLAYNGLTCFM